MPIIEEDSRLGVAKAVWKFTQEPDPFIRRKEEPIESKFENNTAEVSEPLEPEFSEGLVLDEDPGDEDVGTLPGRDMPLEPVNQSDHMGDLRQMVQFLQQVVETQNHQLKTKDELIRNFQVLLKSEQEQVLRLESRIDEKIPVEKQGVPETGWFQSMKRRLLKQ